MVEEENHLEGESGREANHLSILLDRYIGVIGESVDHVVDVLPAIFYDKDELRGDEFSRRICK